MRVEKGAEATVPPGTVPSAATRFHHHHQSKVLLATDGSAEAELAARAAVEQADLTGSELHVVRVGWLPNLLMQDPDIVVGHDCRLYDDSSGWWYNRLTRRHRPPAHAKARRRQRRRSGGYNDPMFTDDQVRAMRDFLADKLAKSDNPQGVHVSRMEIEQWAVERGMTPEDAARLFEDLEGMAWRGEYIGGARFEWQGARITEVWQVPPPL